MEYAFDFEVDGPIPKTIQVVMEIEAIEIQTQNRFGPETAYRLGSRRVSQILNEQNENVKKEYSHLLQEILDHFHNFHMQTVIDHLKSKRSY